MSQFSKLEDSLEFYKSKFDEYNKCLIKIKDQDKTIDTLKIKLKENEKIISLQSSKLSKTKQKLNYFKTKSIDSEIEISKINTENQFLKNDYNEMENKLSNLNIILTDKENQINKINDEKLIKELNKDYENENLEKYILEIRPRESIDKKNFDLENKKDHDEEIEFLEKNQNILIEKYKKIEIENLELKVKIKKNIEEDFEKSNEKKNDLEKNQRTEIKDEIFNLKKNLDVTNLFYLYFKF